MASIDEMREIERDYPNFFKPHLGLMVCCTGQNSEDDQENLKRAFTRTCSKYFYVKNVSIRKGINNCSWCQAEVTYGLPDNKDLPEEPDLKHLVSYLLKHAPTNSVIIGDKRQLELPKHVIIPYEIYCNCRMKFFSKAA